MNKTSYGALPDDYSTAESNPKEPILDPKERFEYVSGPIYHDKWAALLFLAHFGLFVILSGLDLSNQQSQPEQSQNPEATSLPDNVKQRLSWIISVCSLCAVVFSFGYYELMHRFPRQMIYNSFFLSIALHVILGAVYLFINIGSSLIWFLFAGLQGLFYYWWRDRIPLAATTLETVCGITRKYPSTLIVVGAAMILQFAYSVWWATSVVAGQARFDGSMQTGFMIFSLYWTSQVMKNVVHVTVAGVTGSYYFLEGTPAMPRNPAIGAAKRAVTSSFGTICFGSLLIALLETTRFLLQRMAGRNDTLRAVVDCLLGMSQCEQVAPTSSSFYSFNACYYHFPFIVSRGCILLYSGCIEAYAEYFTSFAYVEVAVYGKPFCTAAKDTWALIKLNGYNVLFSDLLVTRVLFMGVYMVSIVTGGLAYFWGTFAFPGAQFDMFGGYVMGVAALCFFVAFVTMSIVSTVVQSGVQTTLVCLAEDPAALARTKPELYEAFRTSYPDIQWRV